MSALNAERDRLVSDFRDFAAAREAGDPAWLAPLRESAIGRFAELGFPSRKREDWKYTNVTPIAKAVVASGARSEDSLSASALREVVDTSGLAHVLVFVNGHFAETLSSPGTLPDGTFVDGVANALREQPALVEPLLGRATTDEDRCFVVLNTAFQRDGAFVWLPRGTALEEPLHLVFVATRSHGGAQHLRNLIALDSGASAVVVEHYVDADGGEYITNAVTDVDLAANAELDHVALKREGEQALHVGTLSAHVRRDARLRSHVFSLGGALVRNEVNVVLAAEGAECVLNGLYLAGGRQHVDNQTTIDHAEPRGTSREHYKGVLAGRAKGVFNGVVIVRPDAQKSDAQQANDNLLLSDGAEINTRPNLEIYADDVKCAHGSTVGRLDDDALFFLRARGIGEQTARQMLARAFAADLVDRIPFAPLREEIHHHVAAKVRNLEEAA